MHRDLVELAVAGDREAFSELIRLSVNRLYAAARLILRDQWRAEDATQDALVAAWQGLSGLRDPDRFEAWLYRVLIRTCHRAARSNIERRQTRLDEVHLDELRFEPPIDLGDRDLLERAFRRLDTDERAILVMHYFVGYSIAEVADVLGVPVGTAKSRLSRASQAMRSALDADARGFDITKERLA